ncbi:MAG: PDZ domain-containing protein [Blastocatellales bacterium]|nr:PDZ domain-containing protein [Blastocatellales bacterium]
MSIRSKMTLITLSAFIAIYSIVGGLLSSTSNSWVKAIADPGPYPQLRIFEDVVRHVVNDYVEKPDLEKVRVGALRGLTDALDVHSAYLLPQQVKEYQQGKDQPDLTGIVIGQYQDFAYVIALVPGSPGEKAGLRVGDIIEYIDGHATRDLDLFDVRTLLKGAPGSSFEVTLLNRRSEKVKITRSAVPAVAPEYRALESQIGYIKAPILSSGQSEAVKKAVQESIRRGASRIILDLRGSAGGDLKEGVAVANLFIKSGTLAKVIGRGGKVVSVHDAKPDLEITNLPLVVIIDRTTAGASEIVAAAVLENKRGEVIGERTFFGMGAEQELFPLDDGSALLLTTSRYASPNGKIFMVDGVAPSIEVKRVDLAEVAGGDDNDEPPNAQASPENPAGAPPVIAAPKPADDQMLKKAIEVLTSGAKAKGRSA